jgi:hypothetical protein
MVQRAVGPARRNDRPFAETAKGRPPQKLSKCDTFSLYERGFRDEVALGG